MAKEFSQHSGIPEVIEKFKVIFGHKGSVNADDLSDMSDMTDEEDDDDYDSSSSSNEVFDEHALMLHLLKAHASDDKFNFRAVRKKKGMNEREVPTLQPQIAQRNAEELVAAEEREKKKAEKRKAKKKRRREKKKEEKEMTTTDIKNKISTSSNNNNSSVSKKENPAQPNKKNTKSKINGELHPEREEREEEEEEDFLDANSAFVSVVVNKNKRTAITHMDRSQRPTSTKKSGDAEDTVVLESERLAVEGYNAASREQYSDAVDFFTKAIQLVHNDHRFFGNRSFCYCQLGQYAKALKDADKAIKFAPQSPKGYYRRAEALRGLKRYMMAEEAFERVIQLDEECDDAKQELENLKIQQLVDMGFDEDQAFAAIQRYNSLEVALEMMFAKGPVISQHNSVGEIFYSDDEDLLSSASAIPRVASAAVLKQQANKMDPSNPEGHLSLWVGNITQNVSEKQLIDLFSRFGVVLSVRLLPEKFCAFINFRDKTAPGPAMKQLQGKDIGGERLLIRYPNNPVPEQIVLKKPLPTTSGISQAKLTGPVNGDECHFWRTTGCAFGSKCRYRHLKENKGVDKKPWQKAV